MWVSCYVKCKWWWWWCWSLFLYVSIVLPKPERVEYLLAFSVLHNCQYLVVNNSNDDDEYDNVNPLYMWVSCYLSLSACHCFFLLSATISCCYVGKSHRHNDDDDDSANSNDDNVVPVCEYHVTWGLSACYCFFLLTPAVAMLENHVGVMMQHWWLLCLLMFLLLAAYCLLCCFLKQNIMIHCTMWSRKSSISPLEQTKTIYWKGLQRRRQKQCLLTIYFYFSSIPKVLSKQLSKIHFALQWWRKKQINVCWRSLFTLHRFQEFLAHNNKQRLKWQKKIKGWYVHMTWTLFTQP